MSINIECTKCGAVIYVREADRASTSDISAAHGFLCPKNAPGAWAECSYPSERPATETASTALVDAGKVFRLATLAERNRLRAAIAKAIGGVLGGGSSP